MSAKRQISGLLFVISIMPFPGCSSAMFEGFRHSYVQYFKATSRKYALMEQPSVSV